MEAKRRRGWLSLGWRGYRKPTHCLVPVCDSFSESGSRHWLAAGGRVMRPVHVSRRWADLAYIGTAHTKGGKAQ